VTSDGVYFDVSKFKDYGKLSGQSLKDKKSGARIQVDSEKRNPQDFALWKFLKGDNANHIMKWESPWGVGFPGWHIECSAMSEKYLGSHFDIHTGGIEHIPIHHENEIAQNSCSHGIKVNYWIHNDHLQVDSEKMSKSLGNVYYISDFIEKGYSPIAFREVCLRTHYRKNLNFTFDSLEAGQHNIKKINEFYSFFKSFKENSKKDSIGKIYNLRLKEFNLALEDDLNTPKALSAVYEFMNDVNKVKEYSNTDIKLILKFIEETNEVLGLLEKEEKVSKEIIKLAKERLKARENKDYKLSDELRDKIKSLGYVVRDSKDSKDGYVLDRI
jgi:cysteinyl-tRNA synthetase